MNFDHAEVVKNTTGIVITAAGLSGGSLKGTVSNSVVSGNSQFAFFVVANGPVTPVLNVVGSVASNNGYGLYSVGAIIRAAQTTVVENDIGWDVSSGGFIYSYGDNYIDGNGTNFGSLTSIAKH